MPGLFAAPLLAAAGDIGGSVVSGMFGTANAKRAQGFSEHMANTAHRREVKDLRLAGLNPILSAGGTGAPSPTGVASTMPDMKPGTAWSQASSAKSQRDVNDSVIQLQKTESALKEQQALTESQRQKTEMANQALTLQTTERMRQLLPFDINLSTAQAAAARNSASQDELWRKVQHKLSGVLDYYFPDLKPGENPASRLPGILPSWGIGQQVNPKVWASPDRAHGGAVFGGKAPPQKAHGASGGW